MADYSESVTDGVTLDILTGDRFKIAVNRKGAELISLAAKAPSGDWKGFLYRDGETAKPASGWANHATVMGYYLHRLWQEHSDYRGHPIQGGNHGFLRAFAFDAPEVGENSLTYRVPADRVPRDFYPLRVSLALTYSLSERGVTLEFAFLNEEPALDAHVSFGLHPGFAVSSPLTAKLLLPPGVYARHMAPGNFLNGEIQEIRHDGGESPFPAADLEGSYILGLAGVPERTLVIDDPVGGRRVSLDFSEAPYVTLWSDMHPFLCVEPCWGLPDSNPPTTFENKPGIQVIAPGATLRRSFTILPTILP
ncbi:MAG: hypothetical protein BGO12_11510 [Verrucomicrobia bacterium 61-8]|nr:hypothetical protein [Verrucomicrobiota bacterium]OJU99124.1 MAG: hypothetical protein BGO12_11510 [Verrucomicrobia bacterium 61-8]